MGTIADLGSKKDWNTFEEIFGPVFWDAGTNPPITSKWQSVKKLPQGTRIDYYPDGEMYAITPGEEKHRLYESKFDLPRRWDGKEIYLDLDKLLYDYYNEVNENYQGTIKDRILVVCDTIREMLRLYLHGYPSDAYLKMKELMEVLDEAPLYTNGNDERIKYLYRMSSVPENIDDKSRIFHAPYNIRPKIRTYRYSIAGYPSLYLAESLQLAEEEMHLFRDKKTAIAARFEFDKEFADKNITKILDFGIRPQDLVSNEPLESEIEGVHSVSKNGAEKARQLKIEKLRAAFEKGVINADKIKQKFIKRNGINGSIKPRKRKALSAPERYMLWYPLIAACSYVRTNREDHFAPEYIIPQLLTQWMRSENTGELVGIRYFSCYSRSASEVGCNYVFPTSGDPIILRDGIRQYCPVLNEAFKFTGTEYLPEYTQGLVDMERVLVRKRAERVFKLTRADFKNENKVELPSQLMYIAARSFMNCTKLNSVSKKAVKTNVGEVVIGGIVSIGDEAFSGCKSINELILCSNLKTIGIKAFKGCKGLQTVTFPMGFEKLDNEAFCGCSALKSIQLKKSIRKIGRRAFGNCPALKTIEFDGTKDEWDAIDKGPSWIKVNNGCVLYYKGGQMQI
ncbi:MAG: leucine-rich repeat domain-containing protein [Clostridia bacterium]|nr:leucine-rich repeat domain-containing protein [Clostridia bacterium]